MACAYPLTAWRLVGMDSPRSSELLWTKPLHIPPTSRLEEVTLPCGQCMLCRISHARMWAVRLEHEAQLHKHAYFLTLTYDPKHVPVLENGLQTLHYKDIQGFLKKLRDRIKPVKIRFYCAGEYGDRSGRPHYHLIIFGYDFPDKIPFGDQKKKRLWLSQMVLELWEYGYHLLAPISFEAMCYVAGYVQKKYKGSKEGKEDHYLGREPERAVMSRRPGIGHDWIMKYKSDVYPTDEIVTSKGFKLRPPRYYDEKIFGMSEDLYELGKHLKENRRSSAENSGVDLERLRCRNELAKKRLRERRAKI